MTEVTFDPATGEVLSQRENPIALLEMYGFLKETSCELPPNLTYEQYELLGWELSRMRRKVQWWISEWISYGERVHGKTYTQAALITGLSEETLKNYVSTAKRVPVERRREELQFSHHQEVASLSPEEQVEWLDKAVVNGWNRRELREHLRPIENGKVTPATPALEEAARALVAGASQSGIDFVVKRQHFHDLCASLEEEFEF